MNRFDDAIGSRLEHSTSIMLATEHRSIEPGTMKAAFDSDPPPDSNISVANQRSRYVIEQAVEHCID